MKVIDLQCPYGHGFEGWFASQDDFQRQCSEGQVECPVCGDVNITRVPSAPRLNAKSNTRTASMLPERRSEADGAQQVAAFSAANSSQLPQSAMQSLWLKVVDHVLKNTEDVGERFAEEARRIHYGEMPERGIRGRATVQEAQQLEEEGIEVMALPIPAALKGSIQ